MGSAVAELPEALAITERGQRIQKTENEVNKALHLVALAGPSKAAALLKEEGHPVHRKTLVSWRDNSFPRRFAQIRQELSRQVTEKVAGDSLEIAQEAGEAERAYIKAAMDRIGEVDASHLAKNALALANAKGNNVQTAQLLRDRPTAIVETRSVEDLMKALERLDVLKKDKAQTIDAEVIEEDDE